MSPRHPAHDWLIVSSRCPASLALVAGAALVSRSAGGRRPASRPGGRAVGRDRLPGEGGAPEGVGEVAAASLAGRLVQLERVQGPAVVRELGPAVVVAMDGAEHPREA